MAMVMGVVGTGLVGAFRTSALPEVRRMLGGLVISTLLLRSIATLTRTVLGVALTEALRGRVHSAPRQSTEQPGRGLPHYSLSRHSQRRPSPNKRPGQVSEHFIARDYYDR